MTDVSVPDPGAHFLRLHDGRRLGYAECGAAEGWPVLFFHGAPGSRRQVDADMAATSAKLGVRLIAPERPGYGLSDVQSGRTPQDWAADIARLADDKGIERFHIVGYSAGGIYALACAHDLPARVAGVALVGGFAPLRVPGVTEGMSPEVSGLCALARSDAQGLRNALAPLAGSAAAGFLAALVQGLPEPDKRIASERSRQFEQDFVEALRQGAEGFACDMILASGPWGFNPAYIRTPVHLWQGEEDRNAPPAMAHYLASVLELRELFMLPGEGHLCLYNHWKAILTRLTSSR